jgi:hypothetical protein
MIGQTDLVVLRADAANIYKRNYTESRITEPEAERRAKTGPPLPCERHAKAVKIFETLLLGSMQAEFRQHPR